MSVQKSRHSTICAGSIIKKPESFAEDESWSCSGLHSTIFAGMNLDLSTKPLQNAEVESRQLTGFLTTINEERNSATTPVSLSPTEDSNILNLNLDALQGDSDVFLDCSPEATTNNRVPPLTSCSPRVSAPKADSAGTNGGPTPAIFTFSPRRNSCTGALLDKIAKDFDSLTMDSQPQSTPNVDVSPRPAASICDDASQVVSSSTIDDASRRGKKSATKKIKRLQGGRDRSPLPSLIPIRMRSPSLLGTTGRVSELKRAFERSPGQQVPTGTPTVRRPLRSIVTRKPIPQPLDLRRWKHSPLATSSSGVSCSYGHSNSSGYNNTSVVPKGKVAAIKRSLATKIPESRHPLVGTPKLHRKTTTAKPKVYLQATCRHATGDNADTHAVHKRSASTSDCPASFSPSTCFTDLLEAPCQRRNSQRRRRRRSLSASAIESSSCSSTSSMSPIATRARFVTVRKYRGSKMPVVPSVCKLQVNKSAIMNRRSLGFVSSPIKSVKELRGIFSPRQRAGGKGLKKQRVADKVPAIVITKTVVVRESIQLKY
ncbi:uncharacterized protein LOC106646942 [Copidosoma floridanum]|uniref:uncharacterized protein LOC106646942 n=1 Tax=Copidosoma floridanum TaxID=29053 RepID=UPI0006C94181|nr:uncharacterized protein LOC106646942 [Copidosoma floridanum]